MGKFKGETSFGPKGRTHMYTHTHVHTAQVALEAQKQGCERDMRRERK